jgi:hypothetical protein
LQADTLQLAYTACLLEAQGSWAAGLQDLEQPATKLSLANDAPLDDGAAEVIINRIVQEASHPADAAAAATSFLQVGGCPASGSQMGNHCSNLACACKR